MSDNPMRILVVEPTKDPYVKEIDGSLASIVGVSTHGFRKWYAAEIYKANGFDIALVQRLLQHSSAAVTQRYIGIEPQKIEAAIQGHAQLF